MVSSKYQVLYGLILELGTTRPNGAFVHKLTDPDLIVANKPSRPFCKAFVNQADRLKEGTSSIYAPCNVDF